MLLFISCNLLSPIYKLTSRIVIQLLMRELFNFGNWLVLLCCGIVRRTNYILLHVLVIDLNPIRWLLIFRIWIVQVLRFLSSFMNINLPWLVSWNKISFLSEILAAHWSQFENSRIWLICHVQELLVLPWRFIIMVIKYRVTYF